MNGLAPALAATLDRKGSLETTLTSAQMLQKRWIGRKLLRCWQFPAKFSFGCFRATFSFWASLVTAVAISPVTLDLACHFANNRSRESTPNCAETNQDCRVYLANYIDKFDVTIGRACPRGYRSSG
jgi:hypothetical protein